MRRKSYASDGEAEAQIGLNVSPKGFVCVCEYTLLCPTLGNPVDCRLPGSFSHGIFTGKNTGVGCHFLIHGNLPDPGTEPVSPASPTVADGFFTTSVPG